jgi:two-component system, cell cycle sensor histidine kinase and response regulator CckA
MGASVPFNDRIAGGIIPLAATLSLVPFLLIGWSVWNVQRIVPEVRQQSQAVRELVGQVDYLDEALTASARLAATTGDLRWQTRYLESERALHTVLDSLRLLAASVNQAEVAEAIVGVADTLAAMEHTALALVREGDLERARALLDSPPYREAKGAYQEHRATLLGALADRTARAEDRVQDQLRSILVLATGSFLILLAVWGLPDYVLRRQMARRRGAESELRAAERRLRTIMDVAPVAIIRVDRHRIVRYWNPAAEKIFGWPAAEVLGQPYPVTGTEPDPPVEQLFARGFEGEPLQDLALRRRRKDGSEVHVRMWNAAERSTDGEVLGLVGVFADVTEQHSLEQRLRQAEKLEAIGQLAGGIAHDFNNVMTAVQGHADLVLETVAPDDPLFRDITEIRRNAGRATELTRQLLAFSRRQVLQPRVLELGAVVRGIVPMLTRLLGEQIQLETHEEDGVGRVEADPTQIGQVIVNLAVNARDAMEDGGRLVIRTENAELTADDADACDYALEPGPYVRLLISDTGRGMDEETQRHVFEPFFTTKPIGRGTGLGLATVYGIVKQSGGYVWVHSEPGRGTQVEILLPRVEKPLTAPDIAEQPAQPGEGGGESILIVEDDDAVRALAGRILRSRGYHVHTAATPAAALALLEEIETIDLLVTDVVLPEMGGHELARRTASRFPTVQVLFMSGYTKDEVLRSDVAAGVSAFLSKPFGPAELATAVREVLDEPR